MMTVGAKEYLARVMIVIALRFILAPVRLIGGEEVVGDDLANTACGHLHDNTSSI